VQTVRKEITKHGLSQSKVVVQSAVLNLHYSFFCVLSGSSKHKKSRRIQVAFRFVSRFVKTPSVCGGIFMNQSGKKIVFCEL
jgi:hypothetical protein